MTYNHTLREFLASIIKKTAKQKFKGKEGVRIITAQEKSVMMGGIISYQLRYILIKPGGRGDQN